LKKQLSCFKIKFKTVTEFTDYRLRSWDGGKNSSCKWPALVPLDAV